MVEIDDTSMRALVTCINSTGNRLTNQVWRHGAPTLMISGSPNPTRRR